MQFSLVCTRPRAHTHTRAHASARLVWAPGASTPVIKSGEAPKCYFREDTTAALKTRLWLAAKAQTTQWTHKPLTSVPNDTAQAPAPAAKAKVPPPCPGLQRPQPQRSQPSEDAEGAHWELEEKPPGEGSRV